MNFFIHTRARRNTAFVVLLVWLFALGSSVANACLLEMREPHSSAAEHSAATTSQAPAGLLAQMGTDVAHHDRWDGTKQSCLKVCDDRANALPKAYSGIDHTDPGPAPLVATLWTGSPNFVSAPRRLGDLEIPTLGPPFRVRYSRLAL